MIITIFQRVLIFEQSVNHRRGPRSWPQIGAAATWLLDLPGIGAPCTEFTMSDREGLSHNPSGGFGGLFGAWDAQVAIVGATGLDEALEGALLTKMRPLSRDMKDRLFDGYGPLANFAAKIDLAFALEIITKDLYDVLRTVNNVRVAFAHSKRVQTFNDPHVSGLLRSLGIDTTTPGTRQNI